MCDEQGALVAQGVVPTHRPRRNACSAREPACAGSDTRESKDGILESVAWALVIVYTVEAVCRIGVFGTFA